MVSALFLIEHAYSHFLHEGLTWRHVLDWTMFSRRHREEIDWEAFDALLTSMASGSFTIRIAGWACTSSVSWLRTA